MIGFVACLLLTLTAAQSGPFYPTNFAYVNGTSSQNVSIHSIEDTLWYTEIAIGQPTQTFKVTIDTGSSVLWVASTSCQYCAIQTRFNTSASQSFTSIGKNYHFTQNIHSVAGQIGTDEVVLIGSPLNQTLRMMFATQELNFAYPDQISGVMGLSNEPFFANIFAGQVSTSIFALVYQPFPFDSYLLYGDIDPIIMNNLMWMQTLSPIKWQFEVPELLLNGVKYSQQMHSAVLDSAVAYLYFDQDFYAHLVYYYIGQLCTSIDYGTGYMCPCRPEITQLAYLPNITIFFANVTVVVPYFNYLMNYFNQTDGLCRLAISSINAEQSTSMVFGAPLFKSMVAVFDKAQNRVGILSDVIDSHSAAVGTYLAIGLLMINI